MKRKTMQESNETKELRDEMRLLIRECEANRFGYDCIIERDKPLDLGHRVSHYRIVPPRCIKHTVGNAIDIYRVACS